MWPIKKHSERKAIYTAPTRAVGQQQLEEFAAKWDAQYPMISKQRYDRS